MSLETWIKEFYPVPAQDVSEKKALNHSIVKWTGLLPKNLRKHGVEWAAPRAIRDAVTLDTFDIDVTTCALCVHHCRSFGEMECEGCPLNQYLGMPCDHEEPDRLDAELYQRSVGPFGDAKLMLDALKGAKKQLAAAAKESAEKPQ